MSIPNINNTPLSFTYALITDYCTCLYILHNKTHRHTHITLQLCSADIGDIECEESLSSANVQHVILFTEEQRGVIEDSIGWKSLGRPLVCIYEQIWKKREGKGKNVSKIEPKRFTAGNMINVQRSDMWSCFSVSFSLRHRFYIVTLYIIIVQKWIKTFKLANIKIFLFLFVFCQINPYSMQSRSGRIIFYFA